ncbi:MAG TPA: hypothetical protein VFS20_19625 [Longimicrobium sp.]|nr:hypothetical protein [Longimicrobium sp.]
MIPIPLATTDGHMKFLDSITRAMRRIAPVLGCALVLSACSTWVEAPPPGPSPLNEISGPIRVVRPDGFSMVLRDAYVAGDTLYGYHEETRMAVPLGEVVTTHRREVDPLRSLGAAAVGAAAAFGAFVLLVLYSYSTAST